MLFRNAMKKKIYKVQGMHCTSCALVIEGDLEDEGIKATCSYAKETLEVEFDEGAVSDQKIQSVVAKSGYTVVSS